MDDKKRSEEIARYWTQAQAVVAAFISSTIYNYEDANDILQAVAVTVVRKYDSYDKEIPFAAWAIGIARYEVLHYKRTQSRDRHIFDDELVNIIARTYQEKSGELEEAKMALENCITKLSNRWKEVLNMRYLRSMDARGIAQCLGVSRNSVFLILRRLRLSLRECIQRSMRMREHEGI